MSEENIVEEIIPSMAEFEEELNRSFKKLSEGDIVKGTVIGISETELTIDLNYYAEGIVKLEEISNDPRFSIKTDVEIGEEVSAVVLREDRNGNILLSMKKAADELAWEKLRELKANRTVCRIKTGEAVPGGGVLHIADSQKAVVDGLGQEGQGNDDRRNGKGYDAPVLKGQKNKDGKGQSQPAGTGIGVADGDEPHAQTGQRGQFAPPGLAVEEEGQQQRKQHDQNFGKVIGVIKEGINTSRHTLVHRHILLRGYDSNTDHALIAAIEGGQ